MKRKTYIANWLSNISVGALIVGGFQDVDPCTRIIAVIVAVAAISLGIRINGKGDTK